MMALKFKGIFVNVGYMDNITNVEVDLKKFIRKDIAFMEYPMHTLLEKILLTRLRVLREMSYHI